MQKILLILLLAMVAVGCSTGAGSDVDADPAALPTSAEVNAAPEPTNPPPTDTPDPVETESVPVDEVAEPTDEPVEVAEESTASDGAFLPAVVTDTTEVVGSWTDAWMLNTTNEMSVVFEDIAVNVTNVYTKTVEGKDYQCIQTSGIPNYNTTVDQTVLDGLINRPKFDTDFANGIEIAVGDTVNFGDDIGYELTSGCTDPGDGYGYWPFGPACPTDQSKDWCFPLDPEPLPEGEVCSTGLNQIGSYINGVSIFNWQDGQSYQNQNVWVNDALHFEVYDLDICVGHSANGNYHHHSNPTCLGQQLGDDGSGPSPIYGFSADGYPLYGPYESAGELVHSCWKTRDYDDPESPTGCGVAGERSCLLVDQYDISKGTEPASQVGPSTSDIIQSMSGNPIQAVSGAYFQDYYYDPDCTAQGPNYLDEHNGHYTEEHGYHYHTTLVEAKDGSLLFAFPHYNGPTYAGVLTDESIAQCSTGTGGPGGPPGGGGPPRGDNDGGAGGQRGGGPDFAAAAEALGVSEDALRDAIGGPPPNFEAAAETLGISAEAIEAALGGGQP